MGVTVRTEERGIRIAAELHGQRFDLLDLRRILGVFDPELEQGAEQQVAFLRGEFHGCTLKPRSTD